MKTSLESLEATRTKKLAVYFAMRKALTTATDSERRALEKSSGELFTELAALAADCRAACPKARYSHF